jgi:sec-independent protein translocase protein TatB
LFDVSFSELVVIAIVALIVIGPEKLPKVARTLGLLLGRLQRYVANVKSDIEREMQFEDLQKLQQEIKQGVEKAQAGAKEVESNIGGAVMQTKKPESPDSPQ